MIDIIASVCLVAAATDCKVLVLPVELDYKRMTPHQCMHVGQAELAKWTEEHPGYWVEKFRCVDGDKRKTDA